MYKQKCNYNNGATFQSMYKPFQKLKNVPNITFIYWPDRSNIMFRN